MTAAAKDMIEQINALVTLREAQGWDTYWRNCMRFALPQDVSYETLLYSGTIGAVTAAMAHGPTSQRNEVQRVYDQTSLWAIERLTAGLLSLKTPEAVQWHNLDVDDPFGYETNLAEQGWLDRLTRYLFKVRSNPKSGFWPAHKAATRSMTALGDGYFFLEETFGDTMVPFRYSFVPLGECYREVDASGRTSLFVRYRRLTAKQIATKWPEAASPKIKTMADSPDSRNTLFPVAHIVMPRTDLERVSGIGATSAPWAGYHIDIDNEAFLAKAGYWEFPYIGHSWDGDNIRPYSEGPLALALAEIKSLNEMSKNELISSQQAVRPPLAMVHDNFTRVDLRAGANNPGLLNGDGQLLVKPIMTHTRPDFAQQVLETRRNSVREMLYLNLWQILIERPDMTATEAMLRAQEKGDLLGPVGISFNHSLSAMLDRELGILDRKGVFGEGQPLEIPESIADKDIMPFFTSPLDRMRNMDEVLGAQRTVQGMLEVAAVDPERGAKMMRRVNLDRYADLLRRGNGAPADLFFTDEQLQAMEKGGGGEQQQQQMQQLMQMIEAVKQGGEAAGAVGKGTQALQGAMAGPSAAAAQAVAA